MSAPADETARVLRDTERERARCAEIAREYGRKNADAIDRATAAEAIARAIEGAGP